MQKDSDLTEALLKLVLFRGNIKDPQGHLNSQMESGRQANELASRWLDSWEGRAIVFMARSFFLADPGGAMSVYGNPEKVKAVFTSRSAESCFVRGWGALFRREPELILPLMRAGAEQEPANPLMQFSLFLALKMEDGRAAEAASVRAALEKNHPKHPVTAAAARLM